MAPKVVPAASLDSSHESCLTSLLHVNGSLDLSFSSHSIAKPKTRPRRTPIIRIVHVFAPKLIKTDVANFRTLVQELTGNRPSKPAEADMVKQGTGHGHSSRQLELRHQKEKETMLTAAPSTPCCSTQSEEDYEDPFMQHGVISQEKTDTDNDGFATSNACFAANQAGLATIGERDAYVPAFDNGELARSEEGFISYFPCAHYNYDDAYSHDHSSSSLDTSSTGGESHISYERGNTACMFGNELDLMKAFGSSSPLMSFDEQHLHQGWLYECPRHQT